MEEPKTGVIIYSCFYPYFNIFLIYALAFSNNFFWLRHCLQQSDFMFSVKCYSFTKELLSKQ